MKEDLISDLQLANQELEEAIKKAMAARKRITKRLTTEESLSEEVNGSLEKIRGAIEETTQASGLLRRAQIMLMEDHR